MLQSWILVALLIPIILFIPVLYYLLPLPYAFGDSYNVASQNMLRDGFESFSTYVKQVISLEQGGNRYRPF